MYPNDTHIAQQQVTQKKKKEIQKAIKGRKEHVPGKVIRHRLK